MLKIKKLTSAIGKKVVTDSGDNFGEVEEVILAENKIDSWRIRVAREMISRLNGAKGVIIPHQFVKAVGDVFVISRSSLPIVDEEDLEISDSETVDLSEEAQAGKE